MNEHHIDCFFQRPNCLKKIKVRLYRSRYLKKGKKHLMLHLNIIFFYISNGTTTVVVFIDTIITLYRNLTWKACIISINSTAIFFSGSYLWTQQYAFYASKNRPSYGIQCVTTTLCTLKMNGLIVLICS